MNKGKLILLLFSLVITLFLIVLSILKLIQDSGDTIISYIFILVGLISYMFYSVKVTFDEFFIYKLDKNEGLQEEVLEFLEMKRIANVDIKYPRITTPIASFKFSSKNEFISLSGDYSKIKLEKGKKYKVSFYRYSKTLIDIRDAYRTEKQILKSF